MQGRGRAWIAAGGLALVLVVIGALWMQKGAAPALAPGYVGASREVVAGGRGGPENGEPETAPMLAASPAEARAEERTNLARPQGAPAQTPPPPDTVAADPAIGERHRSLGYAGSGGTGGVAPPSAPAPTKSFAGPHGAGAAADLPAIDPNGRFATTYRPGGGHLAWFEAQMARGGIPAGARDLVGDLGSHYAPDIEVPAKRALAYRVDLERGALPPSGGPTHLRIALRSGPGARADRAPLSVNVVLDVSGSMEGDPMEQAKQAVAALVGRLQARDRFSLTTFSSDAQVLVDNGPVGPRRAAILAKVASIEARGGTNISGGLDHGYEESKRGPTSADWVRIVMLLSDGRPNGGATSVEALAGRAAQAFQDGIATSSFGLGSEYDPAVMSGIAESGAGGYYYLRDGTSIAPSLAQELDSRLRPVAQAVEVRVRLRSDIRLTQTYGSRRLGEGESAAVRAQEVAVDRQVAARDRIAEDRQQDLEGGMRFFIPGFSPDDRHVILLGIEVPGGLGQRPVADVELRYKDRIAGRNVIDEVPVRVRFAQSDAASVATRDASVAKTVHGFDAGQALLAAARAIDHGDRQAAIAVLAERATLLRQAADSLREPRFRQDAGRLERFRSLIGGGGELSQPLVLSLLLETSGKGLLH